MALRSTYFFSDREREIWALEEKQLHERHQTAKQNVRDQCHLQRQHVALRHAKVSDTKCATSLQAGPLDSGMSNTTLSLVFTEDSRGLKAGFHKA